MDDKIKLSDYYIKRILRWLTYGDTPTDRANNAICYIRYLKLSNDDLERLRITIRTEWTNYKHRVYIADSISLFMGLMDAECGDVLCKENQATSGPTFWDYTKTYASALNECVNIYTNRNTFAVKGDLSELILWKLSVLNKAYDNFVVALYDEMEGIDSRGTNVLYYQISAYLSDATVGRDYQNYNYDRRDCITGDDKRELIYLINQLKYYTDWIDIHYIDPLCEFRKNYKQYVNSVKESREIFNNNQEDVKEINSISIDNKKLALTQNQICLLFKSLKDANCILNKDLKDIAVDISHLTGFSEQKIRQKLGMDKKVHQSHVPLRVAEVLRQIANDLDPQQ